MSADSEKIKTWVAYWRERGYERGETQSFWLSLLSQVLGVAEPERHINFEARVKLEHTNFIDAWLPETKVMIEQKGRGQDLGQPLRQSDGTYLTPIQQAKRYAAELPYSQRPRWIVTCNFQEFRIYDMEHPSLDPVVLQLEELPQRYPELRFLTNFQDERLKREMELSLQAGELVGRLYDALLVKYQDPNDPQNLHSLNMLCVRLVFCLYADDSGLFGGQPLFHHYLEHWQADDLRRALIDLFEILDAPEEERDPYLEDYLAAFPYVNGGLFSQRQITIPQFDEKIRHLLLYGASEDFNWKHISPTIFGAVFESTLNPQTRRSGGMHYTSIANIHKVIDPLFLDDLRAELEAIKKRYKSLPARQKALRQFQTNLAQLYFLDPACGSGNFLTETYLCLRRLENEVLKLLQGGSISFGGEGFNPIQVSIGQFYGIEINDFAVTVAKTALWIAESQMMRETEDVVHMDLDFLPLKSYAHIVWGDALQLDWAEVVPPPVIT